MRPDLKTYLRELGGVQKRRRNCISPKLSSLMAVPTVTPFLSGGYRKSCQKPVYQ